MGTEATATYHWLTHATHRTADLVGEALGGNLGPPERPGGFGQPHRRVHESGVNVFCGSDRPGQPIVLDASGEVCEAWSRDVLKWADDLGAWTTRVDVATDVEPPVLARPRIREALASFKRGTCDTRMRRDSWTLMQSEGEGQGWTLMLGGKTAQLRSRWYDRRGPLRIEHQWRPARDVGEVLPEMLRRKGAAHYWRTLAQATAFPMAWYQQLLKGDVQILPGEVRASSSLGDTMAHLSQQFGVTFWAFAQLGLKLEDLQVVPTHLRGSQVARLKSWAVSELAATMDADRLVGELEKLCRKSK